MVTKSRVIFPLATILLFVVSSQSMSQETTKGKPSANTPASKVMDVVATGAGGSPEAALQNAYSAAIEQAVGVLVDAETLVENDKIVREKILTFSQGFVQNYEEINRWDKDGVFYIRIRAKVSMQKLAESVESSISSRKIRGNVLEKQIRHDVQSEDNAVEIAFRAYRMDKVLKVEILGDPEVVNKDSTQAKLKVKVRLSPDLDAWAELRKKLLPLLGKLATERRSISLPAEQNVAHPGEYQGWRIGSNNHVLGNVVNDEPKIVKGNKVLSMNLDGKKALCVLKRLSPAWREMSFDVFIVPESVFANVASACDREHYIEIALTDSSGRIITKSNQSLSMFKGCVTLTPQNYKKKTLWITPFLWGHSGLWGWIFEPKLEYEETFVVALDDVERVAKCVATIKELNPVDATATTPVRKKTMERK
jgi:hypothetical protein